MSFFLTRAFEEWVADCQEKNIPARPDVIAFALMGREPTRDDDHVPAEKITWQSQDIISGRLNPNAVVFSLTVGEDVPEFRYDWICLIHQKSGTLCGVIKTPEKIKATGETLIRNFAIVWSGLAESAQISAPPQSWQLNLNDWLRAGAGRITRSLHDFFGHHVFIGDAGLAATRGGRTALAAGVAYINGIRTEIEETTLPEPPEKPYLSLRAWSEGYTPEGEPVIRSRLEYADSLPDNNMGNTAPVARYIRPGVWEDLRITTASAEQAARQVADAIHQEVGRAVQAAENAAGHEKTARQHAENAAAETRKAQTHATDAASAREGAESALAATVQQAGIATQRAEEAGNAVKQATRQAELTATARNETVSARDETAAFAREVSESVSQINQKVTTATGAAERAEKAADTTTTNAEQAAASAGNAAKDREATKTLTQRAETAAGRAEEIAGAINLEDASLEKKGITRLSSATDSDSETEAATPKAVKAVMDETNGKAPLDSPALTGTPTAPTAEQSINNTQIATTAFVKAAIAAMVASAPAALDTLNELAMALGNDPQFATTMLNALAGKQPLNEQLTAFSQLDATQNTFPYFDSNSQLSLANVSEAARTLLALTSKEAMQAHLEIEKYTVSDATTYQKGIVKLSSSLASNSEETAATSKAIASVMKIIYGLQPDPSLIVEILGSGTFNAPELGGLILAAYVGEMGSDLKKTTIKRGDDYPGSALTGVDISMGGKTATGLWIDTLIFGFLPGTYRALSGIGSFEIDGRYALGLFIRIK
ncbi:TPA: tail fiber protein [Escherichia coli]|nr:tail fiber protein [Escherichia coli]HBH4732184.1 tail fiber protein [Escherichia coli]